jgi:hypothetical protein
MRENMIIGPPSARGSASWQLLGAARHGGSTLLKLLAILVIPAAAALAAPAEDERVTVGKIVAQIQKADYEGDRVALQQLYANLKPNSWARTALP